MTTHPQVLFSTFCEDDKNMLRLEWPFIIYSFSTCRDNTCLEFYYRSAVAAKDEEPSASVSHGPGHHIRGKNRNLLFTTYASIVVKDIV